ncbi:hypothetical protein D046_3265B, partial [Vibrio parahaemolyticus V-223/04]
NITIIPSMLFATRCTIISESDSK